MDAQEAVHRYQQKIDLCYGIDPAKVTTSANDVPLTVTFAHIYQFLVLDPSPFTGEPKDCAKGMDAILYFKNGWVKSISGRRVQDLYVVHGVVHHSFALNEKPLQPWVLVKEGGNVLAAHCNCAIGILEACSHIGATLFALDGIRTAVNEKKLSVTDLPAYWRKPPSKIRDDLYKKVRDIDFGRKIHTSCLEQRSNTCYESRCADLLAALQEDGISVAAMTQYCGSFDFTCASCTTEEKLKTKFEAYNLQLLFDPTNSLSLNELRQLAPDYYSKLQKTPSELKEIETITAGQAESKWWTMFRSGRITASNLRDVCHTKVLKPSHSLIKKICYPGLTNFSTPSTRYGQKNEGTAVDHLFAAVVESHRNMVKLKSGLVISDEDPCLGASPDALFQCECHGLITVEVKCPFSARNRSDVTEVLLSLTDPFIAKDQNQIIVLNTNHKYYFQALMQVYICKAAFGYFYVWSPNQVYLFEIKRNDEFWRYCKEKAITFFKNVIVPELVGKKYTQASN